MFFWSVKLAKAKGIRVNQLAKELGVPSKLILDRCKAEGLGDKVPNHMSLMSLGLAETVREWFASGAVGMVATAVETATEAAVEAKPKTARRRQKAKDGTEKSEAAEAETAEATVEATEAEVEAEKRIEEAEKPAASEVVEPVVQAEPGELPAVSAVSVAGEVAAGPVSAEVPWSAPVAKAPVVVESPVAAPASVAAVEPAQVGVPSPQAEQLRTAAASAATPAAPPPVDGGAAGDHARHARPTITLANRPEGRPATPKRPPVTPAPKLMVPAPAKIQGPRIVRTEQPDVVPTPRPRRGPGTEQPATTAFVQARPQGGRGVKKTDDDTDEAGNKKKGGKSSRTLSSRRRGPDGRRGEAMEKLKEYTEADLIERRDRLAAASSYRAGFDSDLKKKSERGQHGPTKTIVQKGDPVEVEEPVTVKALSAALGVKSNEIVMRLMKQGVMANVNQSLGREIAETIALQYGIELKIVAEATLEEELEKEVAARTVIVENLMPRPPVVTILGHVDHGKTSLLDRIRKSNVAAGEAGGITQHTAAWMVQMGEKRVTFIDTPGHQAFSSMRARGANMTDVVVLVVSAAEGVQPQTIESINHARAAKVPIVVAMNKIDRADANPDMILGQLAKEGLNPVEWGGDTEVIRTSATTGQGIPELIEILDYQSALLELKADLTLPARGMVIESRIDEGLGVVATVLVQDGMLKVGDIILSGAGYGRIRSLVNDRGEMIPEASPSTPVIVSGLNALPNAGDKFYVVEDIEHARSIAEERQTQSRQKELASQSKVTLSNLLETMKAGETKIINLIIKADVQGSVETLAKTVGEHNTSEVKVQVIHAAVGGINESDIELAAATRDVNSNTVIIGFHVVPDETARQLAEQRHVEIRLYKVIYEILDDLKKALSGMLEPEVREKLHGHVEIRQIFKVSRVGNIAGCMVTDGHIQRGSKIRLIRNGVVIVEELALESLKRAKDDVKEVKSGFECGLKIAGYDDIKLGDRLEAYSRELIHRTL